MPQGDPSSQDPDLGHICRMPFLRHYIHKFQGFDEDVFLGGAVLKRPGSFPSPLREQGHPEELGGSGLVGGRFKKRGSVHRGGPEASKSLHLLLEP